MRIKVWTVAADDDEGTRATVHLTEKDAHRQWLELQFRRSLDPDEQSEKAEAALLIEQEDYRGLWQWESERDLGEPLDTYAIEEHEIEIPT